VVRFSPSERPLLSILLTLPADSIAETPYSRFSGRSWDRSEPGTPCDSPSIPYGKLSEEER